MKKTTATAAALALAAGVLVAPTAGAQEQSAPASSGETNSFPQELLSSPSSTDNRDELVENGDEDYYQPGSLAGSSLGFSPLTGLLVIGGVIAAGAFLVNQVPELEQALNNLGIDTGSSNVFTMLQP